MKMKQNTFYIKIFIRLDTIKLIRMQCLKVIDCFYYFFFRIGRSFFCIDVNSNVTKIILKGNTTRLKKAITSVSVKETTRKLMKIAAIISVYTIIFFFYCINRIGGVFCPLKNTGKSMTLHCNII